MNYHSNATMSHDDAAALGTDPIPARFYYDPEWFELERKAIFMRSWLNVGHVCELPEAGSFICRELEFARASLLIVRDRNGEIRAFHNACTHRGTQLTREMCGRKNTFSCPYHMWTFGTDGGLVAAPDFDRFYVSKDEMALKQVACSVAGGLIFVCLEPQVSLQEFLGPMAQRMEETPAALATTFHEYTYDIEANWKLTYDNFQENYHLRFIHPRTAGPSCSGANPFGYPTRMTFEGLHRTQTIWVNPEAEYPPTLVDALMRNMPRLAADGVLALPHGQDYFALFPNFFLLCTPGNHFLHTVFPISAGRSRGVIRLYWTGDDQTAGVRYARELAMAVTRDIHSEDVAVIQAGQRGLSSGAIEHIHFMEMEVLCRHLITVVKRTVNDYLAPAIAS